jgi:hypothetical protein
MQPTNYKPVILKWLSFVFFTVLSPLIFSQQITDRQTILQFDSINSVLKPGAPLLLVSVPMEEGISNPLFLSEVGGVSFNEVAQPANNLSVSGLKLNYNKKAEDGKRLELIINNKPIIVNLPDWLLIPLVNYANSPWYSCVTIFGKLKDKTLEKQIVEHKGRVINYHPSFDNTLLGIRLAYMDMLVGYNFTNDLPKNNTGNYILGKGEAEPDQYSNQNGAYYLSQHFIRVQNKYDLTFRSYVISDYSRKILFEIKNDSLVIDGFPYFYCWKYNCDRNDYDINQVAEAIATNYNKQIGELSNSTNNQTPQGWMIDKLISLTKRYEGKYGFYSEGTFIDLINLKSDNEKRDFLFNYSLESLFQLIISTEAYMNRDSIVYLKEFSDDVSSKPELFEAANPAVWNATVNTMRFAAFFRYIKNNYPETWVDFISQVKTLDPEPRIITPTIMYNPDSKELEQAIKNCKE